MKFLPCCEILPGIGVSTTLVWRLTSPEGTGHRRHRCGTMTRRALPSKWTYPANWEFLYRDAGREMLLTTVTILLFHPTYFGTHFMDDIIWLVQIKWGVNHIIYFSSTRIKRCSRRTHIVGETYSDWICAFIHPHHTLNMRYWEDYINDDYCGEIYSLFRRALSLVLKYIKKWIDHHSYRSNM